MTGSRLVAGLAMSQTIGYGCLYYAFPVVLSPIAADLHVSTTAVTGAFTGNVLTAAVLAVPVGRWLDRHGGRGLMTAGSLLGVLALVMSSVMDHLWQLYVVQIGAGAAGAASLYEAAFAVIIAGTDSRRRGSALLALTAVAGLASTVFLPLTGWLTDIRGWRTALVVLAAVQAVTVPLHALTIGRPFHSDLTTSHRPRAAVSTALTDRAFWLLAAGFTAHTAAVSALTVHLVGALVAWGHRPAFAATIAGLLGVLSVAGRLLTSGLQRRYRVGTVTAAVFTVQALAALAMPRIGTTTAGAIVTVAGFGIGFGVATIARPLLLAERYDTGRYATLAGVLVIPATLAKAAAPLAAAWLHATTTGYTGVLTGVAACCVIAATAIGAATLRAASPASCVRRGS
ncbi:MFS transporter [Actinoplanes sp. NPDC049548]|uniref:MFS transporter n=1 Tax=Actinoplanes sp. NPDC049548 TaxID=3155152 RepID=UPI0034272033